VEIKVILEKKDHGASLMYINDFMCGLGGKRENYICSRGYAKGLTSINSAKVL